MSIEEGTSGFTCPKCGNTKSYVIDSRGKPGITHKRRRRECPSGHRYNTIEISQEEHDVLIGKPALVALRAGLMEMINRHLSGPRIVPRPADSNTLAGDA